MDQLVRIAIVVGALLAGGGVFYHYVVFLPGLESAKQSQIAADKAEASTKEGMRQLAYETCKSVARQNYDGGWAAACQSAAKDRQTGLRDCLVDPAIMRNQFLGAAYCKRTYADVGSAPDCALPTARANALNALHKEALEKCLAEAKAGV